MNHQQSVWLILVLSIVLTHVSNVNSQPLSLSQAGPNTDTTNGVPSFCGDGFQLCGFVFTGITSVGTVTFYYTDSVSESVTVSLSTYIVQAGTTNVGPSGTLLTSVSQQLPVATTITPAVFTINYSGLSPGSTYMLWATSGSSVVFAGTNAGHGYVLASSTNFAGWSQNYFDTRTLSYTLTTSLVVASGDPHFIGFTGDSFDFMGEAGSVFSLFSSHDLLINARFDKAQNPHLFNYSFEPTFMTEIGIRQGETNWVAFSHHSDPKMAPFKEVVGSNATTTPQTFALDNNGIATWTPPGTFIITFPQYVIKLTREYERTQLAHDVVEVFMGVTMTLTSEFEGMAHGVVGQTIVPLSNRLVGPNDLLQGGGKIQGVWKDYVIPNGHLFGHDFSFNLFNKTIDKTRLNATVVAEVFDSIQA